MASWCSALLPALPTHDVCLVCEECCVQQQEVTYTLSPAPHQCARDILLCRVKGGHIWRPVSPSPVLANPARYQMCRYFSEDRGCSHHRERCTFARSEEEAAVWNFVKKWGLDHNLFCNLLALSDSGPHQDPVQDLRTVLDLKVVCDLCSTQEQEVSYVLKPAVHRCGWSLLLAKGRGGAKWRPVRKRPTNRKLLFKVCMFFKEGSGCTSQQEACTFASTCEEATVWNFLRQRGLDDGQLVQLLTEQEETLTPSLAAKSIQQQLSGSFSELCQECLDTPSRTCSTKRWNHTCTADAAHKWKPVLVYKQTRNRKRITVVRPLPSDSGSPAHSQVEALVWTAERSGLLIRPFLLPPQDKVSIFCRVCRLNFSSPESFYLHCTSSSHAHLLFDNSTIQWKERQPPHGRLDQLWLCGRPNTCPSGALCPGAHSEAELQEWMMRAAEGVLRPSYNSRLVEELRRSSSEAYIMCEQVEDVCISCDRDMTVSVQDGDAALNWTFSVETLRPLVHVALLKQEPGASFSLAGADAPPSIYAPGERFLHKDNGYCIRVSFQASVPGLYEQWVVLDFNRRPVLVKRIQVSTGNRVIVPCLSRTEEKEELLRAYDPSRLRPLHAICVHTRAPLTDSNYKQRMHDFLYEEEEAEEQLVSRLHLHTDVQITATLPSTQKGLIPLAPLHQLFCEVSMPFSLSLDTTEGLLLKKAVHSVLLSPLPSVPSLSKVYEAILLEHRSHSSQLYLQLSKRCCTELDLKSGGSYRMELQFQLDRLHFCQMHKAVDLLPHTRNVIPDLHNCVVPVGRPTCDSLNLKQRAVVAFVTGSTPEGKEVAPLLVYGPFGCGKTFTLATTTRELCRQHGTRVLICTHTNSSADLYIRDHLHPSLEANDHVKPIRIKSDSPNSVMATSSFISKYCLFRNEGHFITQEELHRYNVVITTTTMARCFHELKLPEGYFTHILIDEASQMLECEALMAVSLAGPNTRLVLAGDHMQMGPRLFSSTDRRSPHSTLLTRLFHLYQSRTSGAACKSRIVLTENYRSTKEILDFVCAQFYALKQEVITASGDVPPPSSGHALTFHHVRGKCLLDVASLTWYNREEAGVVVDTVKKILQQWPDTWGSRDEGSVCVLSEGSQVQLIRKKLSRCKLSQVCVQNLANVQGNQFRAVVLTTVQTRDSLRTANVGGLELFNDAHVLNTAITRAQSLVAVVGDAAALSCSGKCSRVWRSYIEHCLHNQSVTPTHFSQEFFTRDIEETVKFQKPEPEEESSELSDAILRELESEYEEMQRHYDSDSEDSELHRFAPAEEKGETAGRSESLLQGTLVRKTTTWGYVLPSNSSCRQVIIKGRRNLDKAFTGEEVLVQLSPEPRVIAVIRESARRFRCLMEEEDHSKWSSTNQKKYIRIMMVPIKRSEPKICVLINKEMPDLLPVWTKGQHRSWEIGLHKRLDGTLKRNSVFVVQVIGWKDGCWFPLGNVVNVLPIGGSFSSELESLKEELQLGAQTCRPNWTSLSDRNVALRTDLTEVTTFTIDPSGAEALDDAISVQHMGEDFRLGVHITDVASFVSPGSDLDTYARQQGFSCSHGESSIHLFSQDLSRSLFSLLPGRERAVISLMFTVETKTNRIKGSPVFQLSLIRSDQQLSYTHVEDLITNGHREFVGQDTVEDCVHVAYSFAKAQRKARLVDWVYSRPHKDQLPGKRKARLMIEELNVLFNKHVSQTLIKAKETWACTPLFCQNKPYPAKIRDLEENHGAVIPLSFHLRHRLRHDNQDPDLNTFCVAPSVWDNICSAARREDVDTMVDLIAADDIHPQLQPAIHQFQGSHRRTNIVCSSSSKAAVGHYSLGLTSYTKASSPLRRYLDIILQRLLHSVIGNQKVQYAQTEIEALCQEFQENRQKAKLYKDKAEQIFYGVSMMNTSVSKLAFVVQLRPKDGCFTVSFPFHQSVFSGGLSIMFRDLQLEKLPEEDSQCIILSWRKWIFKDSTMPSFSSRGPYIEVPLQTWRAAIKAVEEEDWGHVSSLMINTDVELRQQKDSQTPPTEARDGAEEKNKSAEGEICLCLQRGSTLKVQITSEMQRGYHIPTLQLVQVQPDFEICVDHIHNPIKGFSKMAERSSKENYHDTNDYMDVWKPLCDMEAAVKAVGENKSILMENVKIKFSQNQSGSLTGSISIPWNVKECVNSCILGKSYLCIRKRGIPQSSSVLLAPLVDPAEITWIAHGITHCVENQEVVKFSINYLPMKHIPGCVFQKNTRFTVEVIPKFLPDIREIDAVLNINTACDLTKAIALGRRPQTKGQPTRPVLKLVQPTGLPELNSTQSDAVNRALSNSFTLIQGPPGTGKTTVGVSIIFNLIKLNSEHPRELMDQSGNAKKEVVLYCGPSNKSVDVVAEMLMKFKGLMKPLRVYSQHTENAEYPSPDNTLQWSRSRLCQDRSKDELRAITLHHRVRQPQNIYSTEIKAMDQRFKEALQKKWPISLEDLKRYKGLLKDARALEFREHDVILCTCAESSNPTLTRTVNARQILVDECAMATEPQTLIPLVHHQPEKVVLIGDHKQLRPIVKSDCARKLGMAKSLFERWDTIKGSVMLDTQYRMHQDICQFPSLQFYEGKLRTGREQRSSVLRVQDRVMPLVFGDVKGTTVTQVVSTASGNENSKANKEEREVVIRITEDLVKIAHVQPESIVILSPYNSQVSELRKELKERQLESIPVTTITKSQGSEWRYVLLSTVCSLPSEQVEKEPPRSWLAYNLGFVADPNLINVALTRAKEGLCIIGDQELLRCNITWRRLLQHCSSTNTLTGAKDITVKNPESS